MEYSVLTFFVSFQLCKVLNSMEIVRQAVRNLPESLHVQRLHNALLVQLGNEAQAKQALNDLVKISEDASSKLEFELRCAIYRCSAKVTLQKLFLTTHWLSAEAFAKFPLKVRDNALLRKKFINSWILTKFCRLGKKRFYDELKIRLLNLLLWIRVSGRIDFAPSHSELIPRRLRNGPRPLFRRTLE